MSRRSSRLASGGYYNSDEESDSSSVTNITYRENPVKVFKKKVGTRKASSRTSSRANSNASSPSYEPHVSAGQSHGPRPSLSSSPTLANMRKAPYVFTPATPRPALTSSSTLSQSQTPTSQPSAMPETSPYSGHCISSRPGLHLRPQNNELSQCGVESSGYSSSEGACWKPIEATSSTSKIVTSRASNSGYITRINSAFCSLRDSASVTTAAAQSKIKHLRTLALTSPSNRMKKACGAFLLLLIILLCIWFFLSFYSFISRMSVTKTPSLSEPTNQPVTTPPPQPNTMHHAPVVDPDILSAAIDAKIEHHLRALELKQDHFLSQKRDEVKLDLQGMKAKLEVLDLESRVRLEQGVAGLGRQMTEYQTNIKSAATSLSLRVQVLEAQNAKLSQELSSIQLMPSPSPCPDTSTIPLHNHLTPELQEAMEKWLTERIKEQDALRLGDKGCSPDVDRPMADKMADFALETQGASVVSTRCSETYRIRSACVSLFGFPIWYPSESPRTVIQGYPVLLPGKCWAFHGVQGTLVISLSHPVRITHVTLDHLPRYNSPTGRIDSAPKDFEVYGMNNDTDEGTLLGTFTYNENGESTQTFELHNPTDDVNTLVELRVLSNWGHVEYTCLYRFRVHGKILST